MNAQPVAGPTTRWRKVLTWPAAMWLLLLGSIWAAVLLNQFGHLTPDIKPEIYLAPARMAHDYLFAWQEDPQLGFPSFNVGLAPVAAAVAGLQALGLDTWLSARVLRGLLLTTGALGAAVFVRAAARDVRPPAGSALVGVLAAAAFIMNPYTVVAGATLAILLPMAFLPWQMWCLLRAFEHRGWKWPALFGLSLVAMSGMNAGVVPLLQLLAIPGVVALVRVRTAASWRDLAWTLTKCGLAGLAVSLYWVVPTLGAIDSGTTVVENSESLSGVSAVSSFAEVQRGLGLWPMYGADSNGPWQPGFAVFIVMPLLIVATFLVPSAAALVSGWIGDRAVRLGGILLVAVAATVMVGTHAPMSPFSRLLAWAFENLPFTAGFRTTNKVGSVWVQGLAVLVAVGLGALLTARGSRAGRAGAGAVALLLAVLSCWPALSGRLYPTTYDVPSYWFDAAKALDSEQHSRLWFLPGESLAGYRWTDPAPDDLSKALFRRPTLVRTTLPTFSPESSNILAAADSAVSDDVLPGAALATYARYLGVSQLLVRSDLAWERYGGPDPQAVLARVRGSSAIVPLAEFGGPGQNTVSNQPGVTVEDLRPLSAFTVQGGTSVVRTAPVRGELLLDGDAYAVADLAGDGLLDGIRPFRYLGSMNSTDFSASLSSAGRLVLTDTNRRRTTVPNRMVNAAGPLLAPTEVLGPSRTLFDTPEQTTLDVKGGSANASEAGSAFGVLAGASAENAFDGDPSTSWQAGDFGRGIGQWVRRTFPQPVTVQKVLITVADLGPLQVSAVQVSAGSKVVAADVPPRGQLEVDLGGVRAADLTVTVTGTRGSGYNGIGISEVSVAGAEPLSRWARLPATLQNLLAGDPALLTRLAAVPVDISLSRSRGGVGAGDDEERSLNREFHIPDARVLTVSGWVRPSAAATEADYDEWAGYSDEVTVRTTSRAFDAPSSRGSYAFDQRPDTAWIPGRDVVGEALVVRGPPQRVRMIAIDQGGTAAANWVSQVRIQLDGGRSFSSYLGAGETFVSIPRELRGAPVSEVRIEIGALAHPVSVGLPRIGQISVGDWAMERVRAGSADQCLDVLAVDGQPLRVLPTHRLLDDRPVPFQSCDGPLGLGPGDHYTRGTPAFSVDHLLMQDIKAEPSLSGTAPQMILTSSTPTRKVLKVDGAVAPYYVILGESSHEGWSARLDGQPLPGSGVVDGYSKAWTITQRGAHTLELRFDPQRRSTIVAWFSAGAILALVVLALRPAELLGARTGSGRGHQVARAVGRRGGGEPGAARRLATPVLLAFGTGWFLTDPLVGVLVGAAAAWVFAARPPARVVSAAAAGCYAVVPVAWLGANMSRLGQVSPELVTATSWPHRLAALGLALLVLSVFAPVDRVVEDDGPGSDEDSS